MARLEIEAYSFLLFGQTQTIPFRRPEGCFVKGGGNHVHMARLFLDERKEPDQKEGQRRTEHRATD